MHFRAVASTGADGAGEALPLLEIWEFDLKTKVSEARFGQHDERSHENQYWEMTCIVI